MFIFRDLLSGDTSRGLFNVFHPAHVFLSAVATAGMFKLHSKKSGFIVILLIGYIGSVGIATLSDSLIPYAGESLLDLRVSAHGHTNDKEHDHEAEAEHMPTDPAQRHGGAHIGFIELWYIVNPAAIIGVLIAYFRPLTKFPHTGHVLLSIWASLFHILMAMGSDISFAQWLGVFVFLFMAVWLPCCISDIVFPLLFVKPDDPLPKHSH